MGTDRLLLNMPLNAFDTALLWSVKQPAWQPNVFDPLAIPVSVLANLSLTPPPQLQSRLPDAPSWSWAGRRGQVTYVVRSWHLPVASYYIRDLQTSAIPEAVALIRLWQFWEGLDGNTASPERWRVMKTTEQYPPRLETPASQVVTIPPPNTDLARCLCIETLCASAFTFRLSWNDAILHELDVPVGEINLNTPNPAETDISRMEILVLSLCVRSTRHAWPAAASEAEIFFPDPETDKTVPFARDDEHKMPMTCCRVLLVDKTERGTYERRGEGEMGVKALEHVGLNRKWVFLE